MHWYTQKQNKKKTCEQHIIRSDGMLSHWSEDPPTHTSTEYDTTSSAVSVGLNQHMVNIITPPQTE